MRGVREKVGDKGPEKSKPPDLQAFCCAQARATVELSSQLVDRPPIANLPT